MKNTFLILLLAFGLNQGFSQNWKSNFEEAKKEATEQNKRILLVFAGSDWCGPCIKLDKNIWQSDEFKKFSDKNYVLYRADFPKKKANQLSEELKKQNEALAEKYNQDGNYPLVLLLDNKGKTIGIMGYESIGADQYIEKLIALDKK